MAAFGLAICDGKSETAADTLPAEIGIRLGRIAVVAERIIDAARTRATPGLMMPGTCSRSSPRTVARSATPPPRAS